MKGLGLLTLLVLIHCQPNKSEKLTLFCASSCQPWLEACLQSLPEVDRQSVQVSYGASGTLAQQILMGAPAKMMISAHPDWSRRLLEQKPAFAVDVLFHNHLVLVGRSESFISVEEALAEHAWVMGDPGYVPLGAYTQQALTGLGLNYKDLKPIFADSARSAVALLQSGHVQLGVLYRSDALSANLPILYNFSENIHDPIQYELLWQENDKQTAHWREILLNKRNLAYPFGFEG